MSGGPRIGRSRQSVKEEGALNEQGAEPNSAQPLALIGSPGRTRTADKVVNSHLLYQLSYRGSVARCGWRRSQTPRQNHPAGKFTPAQANISADVYQTTRHAPSGHCGGKFELRGGAGCAWANWRSGPESNRRTRLCRPLHNHSATGPHRCTALQIKRCMCLRDIRASLLRVKLASERAIIRTLDAFPKAQRLSQRICIHCHRPTVGYIKHAVSFAIQSIPN